jgi:hypothetical protein
LDGLLHRSWQLSHRSCFRFPRCLHTPGRHLP